MQSPFTYLFVDQSTQEVLAELPLAGPTFSQRLNGAGSLNGTINLADPRVQKLFAVEAMETGKVETYVVENGVIVWGGYLWTASYQMSTFLQTIGANEFWSYMAQRVQAQDYTDTWATTATDPLVIAQTLVQDVLDVPSSGLSDMAVVLNGATGEEFWVNVSYPSSQLQTVDSLVSMLSQMGPLAGFDYSIDCNFDTAGNFVKVCNLYTPRKGRSYDQSQIVVDTRNASDYTYPTDSTKQATTVWVRGSGTTTTQASAADPAPLLGGWPVLELVMSVMNISAMGALQAIANGDVAIVSTPVATPTITLPLNQFPLGSFSMGDDLRWMHEGDERFPDGFDEEWRIAGTDVTIPDEGDPTIMLTFNTPPVFD